MIVLAWLVLQFGGLFSPGLLDDVDSIYIEIAREMLHRHDYVTPYIDGLRFFDKPPLMYWMAAASMRLFGECDWAGRLPLALGMLALLLAVYALGLRLYAAISPGRHPDRGALYSALALATAIGPYLYTRFYIPDLIIALWMTLSVHLFLIALERIQESATHGVPHVSTSRRGSLLPCLGFAAVLALNLLTKGLIGILFPLGFVVLYLIFTGQLKLLPKFHIVWSTLLFLAIALPWHILIAIRNPAIAMPPGNELPAKAGWAWFYLYNEHFARFLGKRVPHDYGLTPIWLFWLYGAIWIMPWMVFLPAAIARIWKDLVPHFRAAKGGNRAGNPSFASLSEAALTVTLWSLMVMLFFTVSSRQEYYQLPAMPALALMAGGFLALAECTPRGMQEERAWRASLACHRWLLLPLVSLVGCVCAFFAITAPQPMPGADLFSLLSRDPALYNLSLGHIFDLRSAAMGFFRGPLIVVAAGMVVMGPVSYGLRKTRRTFAANLVLAAGMAAVLATAHEGLVRFYPILGSKDLALAIVKAQQAQPSSNDLILLDGELTTGSSLIFYTREPLRLVNGHLNGPWFGGFWPDAPRVFEDEASLRRLWQGPSRVFLMTYVPASRTTDLESFGLVHVVASSGGKTVLTNR
jgi:4-amino-4-deoxy-L-arabinose transferase-like glycosyltransferase